MRRSARLATLAATCAVVAACGTAPREPIPITPSREVATAPVARVAVAPPPRDASTFAVAPSQKARSVVVSRRRGLRAPAARRPAQRHRDRVRGKGRRCAGAIPRWVPASTSATCAARAGGRVYAPTAPRSRSRPRPKYDRKVMRVFQLDVPTASALPRGARALGLPGGRDPRSAQPPPRGTRLGCPAGADVSSARARFPEGARALGPPGGRGVSERERASRGARALLPGGARPPRVRARFPEAPRPGTVGVAPEAQAHPQHRDLDGGCGSRARERASPEGTATSMRCGFRVRKRTSPEGHRDLTAVAKRASASPATGCPSVAGRGVADGWRRNERPRASRRTRRTIRAGRKPWAG
jgi:hypothetical protein